MAGSFPEQTAPKSGMYLAQCRKSRKSISGYGGVNGRFGFRSKTSVSIDFLFDPRGTSEVVGSRQSSPLCPFRGEPMLNIPDLISI